ncbi:MAG: hypothetical protein EOP52_05390 [Sphingobacteriales bacterium]|nr:MAG: hypothetical protein EOP52_05390 [Sphingobacteriales bacterium]
MKHKILAVSGGLLLGVVALFTLVHLLKAALGTAVIFMAGRGLMRLWHRYNHRTPVTHYSGPGSIVAAPFRSAPMPSVSHPTPGIVPIW